MSTPKSKTYTVKMMSTKDLTYGGKNYGGMNLKAANALGYHWPHGEHVVGVDKTMPEHLQHETMNHEIIEKEAMDKGMPYFEAHAHANRHMNDPLPEHIKITREE
jgi:hypothetical protein